MIKVKKISLRQTNIFKAFKFVTLNQIYDSRVLCPNGHSIQISSAKQINGQLLKVYMHLLMYYIEGRKDLTLLSSW